MVTIRPDTDQPLELDYCRRCGGVWFDAGEVAALRAARPRALWAHVELRPEAFRHKCHRCLASFRRDEPACPACGHANVLRCPADGNALTRVVQDGLALDACVACRGVWFDNTELAEIWNRAVAKVSRERAGAAVPASLEADSFLLYAMIWSPDAAVIAGHAVAGAIVPIADVAGQVALEGAEAAGTVFGAIADLIGGIFDALG